jgi:hypothetical protein
MIEGMMDRIEGSLIDVRFANGHQQSHSHHKEEIRVVIS